MRPLPLASLVQSLLHCSANGIVGFDSAFHRIIRCMYARVHPATLSLRTLGVLSERRFAGGGHIRVFSHT